MNSFSECLKQISLLTKKNLQILRMINDSFYTNKNHLVSIVDGEQYVIPSFLSLESKIDNIEANLQNILDAPKTGEAYTYYDGTTQKIELMGYSSTPPRTNLSIPETFTTSVNHIFKDFMTPQPVVRFDISSISNNTKHVIVKKVAIKNADLLDLILEYLKNPQTHEGDVTGGNLEYSDIVKAVFNFEPEIDYIDYDTVRRLPIRSENPFGEYNIIEISDHWQDSNFEEHYILGLDSDLVYYINNGTIQRNISIGDTLVTRNDKVEMEIEDTNPVNRTITVKILHGAYAELSDKTTGNPDMFQLKYHQVNKEAFDKTKYIEVPLEEDQFICLFVAPLNDTTNVQAPWGTGVFLNTAYLVMNGEEVSFDQYYKDNVNNIGDALFALTNMMNDDDQIEKLTPSRFESLSTLKPPINTENITIYQINKHLNDSESIKTIRNLYQQKTQYKNNLEDIQRQIDTVTANLSQTSFDDVTGVRASYNIQLSDLNSKKYELTQNIASISQEISENANSSDTPIENAKYHIRGFINTDIQADDCKVIGIDVEYRYKNKNKFTGNAETIGESYIFSDWNKMNGFMNTKSPSFDLTWHYQWDPNNENLNEPSFNQIDIPITQGENVDIRVRYIYNLGYPLITFTSAWSEILNMEFPEEFVKDVEILDIIAENNEDIRKNQFMNMMERQGVIKHVDDKVIDMDLEYFHNADHIASGFFTDDRRVIPLSDQLFKMVNTLSELQAEVNGASVELQVSITDGTSQMDLLQNMVNTFRTRSYINAISEGYYQIMEMIKSSSDSTPLNVPMAISNLVINIYNPSEYPVRLHSMFPGDTDEILSSSSAVSKFDPGYYTGGAKMSDGSLAKSDSDSLWGGDTSQYGVWMLLSGDDGDKMSLQHLNQIVYFRTRLASTQPLYALGVGSDPNYSFPMQSVSDNNFNGKLPNNLMDASSSNIYEMMNQLQYVKSGNGNYLGMASLYPHIGNLTDISAPAGSDYIVIKPQESVQLTLDYAYWLAGNNIIATNEDQLSSADIASLTSSTTSPFEAKISRALAFDIRTSLFTDPITYKIVVEAQYQDLQSYKMKTVNKKDVRKQYTPVTNSVATGSMVNKGKRPR